jgi:hypothetical protein
MCCARLVSVEDGERYSLWVSWCEARIEAADVGQYVLQTAKCTYLMCDGDLQQRC